MGTVSCEVPAILTEEIFCNKMKLANGTKRRNLAVL